MSEQTQNIDYGFMTIKEAAEFLRISPKTLYVYTCNSGASGGQRRNQFPSEVYVKLGRKVLFIKPKLIAWIQSGALFNQGRE